MVNKSEVEYITLSSFFLPMHCNFCAYLRKIQKSNFVYWGRAEIPHVLVIAYKLNIHDGWKCMWENFQWLYNRSFNLQQSNVAILKINKDKGENTYDLERRYDIFRIRGSY